MKPELSLYNAIASRAIDGDSFVAQAKARSLVPDAPFLVCRVRVIYVDTPERGEEGWSEAKTFLDGWIHAGPFNLICFGRDKYGRLLADAERGLDSLSQMILAEGHGHRMSEEDVRSRLIEPNVTGYRT